jgi:hypothetical protein
LRTGGRSAHRIHCKLRRVRHFVLYCVVAFTLLLVSTNGALSMCAQPVWRSMLFHTCMTPLQLHTFPGTRADTTHAHRRAKPHVPKELLPPEPHADRHTHLERHHPKGFSLAKVLPLSGVLCFGSYCNFNTRARVSCVYLWCYVRSVTAGVTRYTAHGRCG